MASRPPAFHLPQLDALRFFAFGMVFVHHAMPKSADHYPILGSLAAALVDTGRYGVDLFFVLSSFLITTLLLREIRETGRLALPAFYARRALRIWPLFFLYMGIAVLLLGGSGLDQVGHGYFAAYLLFVGNWATAIHGFPSEAAVPVFFIGHIWSLCIEEQFYLLWPPLVQRISRRGLQRLAVGLIVVGVGSRLVMVLAGADGVALWTATVARLDPIGIGILLATIRVPKINPYLGLASGFALILAANAVVLALGIGARVPAYLAIAVGSGLMVVCAIRLPAPPPSFVYLGRISYGLYVYHVLALVIAKRAILPHNAATELAAVGLAFVLTLALAALSYRFYERPFLRLKARYEIVRSRPVAEPATAPAAIPAYPITPAASA